MKLRPFNGSCTTSRFSMTSLISAVVVWRSGAAAATVTCSETPSTPSVNSRSSVRPSSSASDRFCGAKPLKRGGDLPGPIRSAGRKKRPCSSVTRSTTVPLAGCLAVTVAPGSTAPELSFTTPPISAVFVWPAPADAIPIRSKNANNSWGARMREKVISPLPRLL